MAKYRKASEKTIARGKGISTDKLSLSEAKDYFNERAKETGAKRFRHNGQVYDLNGNKISEAPARSSGGGSSSSPSKPAGSQRPRARPETSAGGAKADERRAGSPPKAPASGSPTKRAEVSPAAVAAMGAGAVAAGVAAARSGRGPATGGRVTGGGSAMTGRNALPKPPTRLALPAPNKGGTIIPENKKTPALPKPDGAKGENKSNVQKAIEKSRKTPKAKPAKPKKGPGGSRSGVRGGIGVDITTNPLEQIKDPLQLMNKGGMVRKKK